MGPKPGPRGVKKSGSVRFGQKCRALNRLPNLATLIAHVAYIYIPVKVINNMPLKFEFLYHYITYRLYVMVQKFNRQLVIISSASVKTLMLSSTHGIFCCVKMHSFSMGIYAA